MAIDPSILDTTPFNPASPDDWRRAAEKAMRGADISELTSLVDGLAIEPLTRPAKGRFPLRMRRPGWKIVQRIDDPDPARAATQAEADVKGGADGLSLVFEGAVNAFGRGLPGTREALAAVLDGVDLERTAIRIDAHPLVRRSADWLVDLIAARGANPARLSIAIGIDHGAILAATGRLGMSLDALKASMPQSMSGFFAIGLPGILLEADVRGLHNAGATAAQELGAALSTAVAHLRLFTEARQPVVYGAPFIGFAVAVDQDFLLSIAKLRALRLLWRRVQELCGIETPLVARIHAETSYRMASAGDFESNLLRNTIAVSAAAIGGADSVSTLPHTIACGLPDPFARRLARSMQLVARDESHIGLVSDPAAGAGSLEALTDALCEAAWHEFQTLEGEGGTLLSLAANRLQGRIRQEAEKRVATAPKVIGVTIYPDPKPRSAETLSHVAPSTEFDAALHCERLDPQSVDTLVSARSGA